MNQQRTCLRQMNIKQRTYNVHGRRMNAEQQTHCTTSTLYTAYVPGEEMSSNEHATYCYVHDLRMNVEQRTYNVHAKRKSIV